MEVGTIEVIVGGNLLCQNTCYGNGVCGIGFPVFGCVCPDGLYKFSRKESTCVKKENCPKKGR